MVRVTRRHATCGRKWPDCSARSGRKRFPNCGKLKSELQLPRARKTPSTSGCRRFQNSGSARQSQVRLRELETAANSYRGIYDFPCRDLPQWADRFPSTEARVVTFASPPFLPVRRKSRCLSHLGGFTGLGLGGLLGFGREQLNRRIHTRAQIEELLNTSCLAVLPLFRNETGVLGRPRPAVGAQAFVKFSMRLHFLAPPRPSVISRSPSICTDSTTIRWISALPGKGQTTVATSFAAFVAKPDLRKPFDDEDAWLFESTSGC